MASYQVIAAATRSIRTLLRDRMVTGVGVTVAPPDQTVTGFDGARVNLYLIQVIENASLKNDHGPHRGPPGSYGRPPLSLNLRYMLTSHSDSEVMPESDLTAQEILGDALHVLHMYGARMHELIQENLVPPALNEPILDPLLTQEPERFKLTLYPASLEDVTKIWSALSEENFRRSVILEGTVVQIDDTEPVRVAPPVTERRIFATLARRPTIERVFVTPPPGQPEAEMRVAVGEEITIVARDAAAARIFVQFGDLTPLRVVPAPDGRIRVRVPDAVLDVDYDPPLSQPILPAQRLQPGTLQIRLIAELTVEGVAGALDRGSRIEETRRVPSNIALMQLVPQITGVAPVNGDAGTVLTVTGTRLWHPGAREAQVVLGDAGIEINRPPPSPLLPPAPGSVQVPVADAGLPAQAGGDPGYRVAVLVDGVRSRDDGFTFHLDP